MVQDNFIVRCSQCGAKNRIPRSRAGERAVCGKCRTPLQFTAAYPERTMRRGRTHIRLRSPQVPRTRVRRFSGRHGAATASDLLPIIDELATEYSGLVKFIKIDMDKSPGLASQYQVMSVPTMLVFKNGKLVNRLVGALPKDQIVNHLRAFAVAGRRQ